MAEALDRLSAKQNVFIQGYAGTGKSTFINTLRKQFKNTVVVAPTGIAALNINGQTIHSFFWIKPQNAIPYNSEFIKRHIKLSTLFEHIDLLIIDEISMVRADVFDLIDAILRANTQSNTPFGGVLTCVVGDMAQLPPVLTSRMRKAYDAQYPRTRGQDNRFFTCAECFRSMGFHEIHFKKIFRQQDRDFIDLLAQIRQNDASPTVLTQLNNRTLDALGLDAPPEESQQLTPTRNAALSINMAKLRALPGDIISYPAKLNDLADGHDDERLPAPETLMLKEGARVMFVKNDSRHRWVNGTIGTVSGLEDDTIHVSINGATYPVGREEWKKVSYKYNKRTDSVTTTEQTCFIQFPLTLAWAVTIHKAQGLTLDQVHIDLGTGTFDTGQFYVAISRCKTFQGLTFSRPVRLNDIR